MKTLRQPGPDPDHVRADDKPARPLPAAAPRPITFKRPLPAPLPHWPAARRVVCSPPPWGAGEGEGGPSESAARLPRPPRPAGPARRRLGFSLLGAQAFILLTRVSEPACGRAPRSALGSAPPDSASRVRVRVSRSSARACGRPAAAAARTRTRTHAHAHKFLDAGGSCSGAAQRGASPNLNVGSSGSSSGPVHHQHDERRGAAARRCRRRRRHGARLLGGVRPVGVRLRLPVLAPRLRLPSLRHRLRQGLRPQVLAGQHDTPRHGGPAGPSGDPCRGERRRGLGSRLRTDRGGGAAVPGQPGVQAGRLRHQVRHLLPQEAVRRRRRRLQRRHARPALPRPPVRGHPQQPPVARRRAAPPDRGADRVVPGRHRAQRRVPAAPGRLHARRGARGRRRPPVLAGATGAARGPSAAALPADADGRGAEGRGRRRRRRQGAGRPGADPGGHGGHRHRRRPQRRRGRRGHRSAGRRPRAGGRCRGRRRRRGCRPSPPPSPSPPPPSPPSPPRAAGAAARAAARGLRVAGHHQEAALPQHLTGAAVDCLCQCFVNLSSPVGRGPSR